MKKEILLVLLLTFCLQSFSLQAQDRFTAIEAKLKELASTSPGLNEKVELSFNGISIQEYIRSLSEASNLNIVVDGNINIKIYTNFSDATVSDILLLLCKKYDLDISFVGSIMSISPYIPPAQVPLKYASKQLKISYDKATDQLSFDLNNDSLSSVVKEITRLSQKNVLFSQEFSNKLVSGYIQNASFKGALDKLAFANDFRVTPTEDNYFLIEKKDAELAAGSKGSASRKTGKTQANASMPEGLNLKIDGSGLITADAVSTPIIDILEAVSSQLNNNYFLFSEPKGNATLNIKNSTYDDFLNRLLNGTDYTFKKEGNIYLIGDRNLEGLRATKLIQLKFRSAEKVTDVIPADLKKGLDIKPFPDLNSLILSGSQPRIDELEAFLRDIDKVVPVVIIEVLIVDIRDTKTVSTGIQAGIGTPPATQSTAFPGVDVNLSSTAINNIISGINGLGAVNLGKVTPNFYLSIKALETQGILKLRSTPKLATLNGHEAKMSIGNTEYYLETQTTLVGSVSATSQQSQNYKSVNADLSVTINPMVSGDEQITMDIKVKQSSFTARISPTAPPGSITRDFQSVIRVKNEEMIILGGLEENSTNDAGSGTPILSRIPVIKWFFSSRTNARSKNKLTIFIKPTVVY